MEFKEWAKTIELPENYYREGVKIGDVTYNNYRNVWAIINSLVGDKRHLEKKIDRLEFDNKWQGDKLRHLRAVVEAETEEFKND